MSDRRWFQIHSSTALLAACIVIVVVYLSFQPRMLHLDTSDRCYGWPCDSVFWYWESPRPYYFVSWMYMGMNLLTLLAILAPALVASEWLARRGWLKIHLSTALAAMLVASVLLGLNIFYIERGVFKEGSTTYSYASGWPFFNWAWNDSSVNIGSMAGLWNVAVNAGILVSIAGLIEWFIRRNRASPRTQAQRAEM
jgi:hypothetical protein